jgi:hypothetical protein
MTEETINYAGQVHLIECSIYKMTIDVVVDIVSLVWQLELYEDIMAPFVSGRVVLSDSMNISYHTPLMGDEWLYVHYRTPLMKEVKKFFQIYKLSNKLYAGDKKTAYELYIVSANAAYDANQRISKSFSGYPHEIADEVYKKYIETRPIGEDYRLYYDDIISNNQIKFISNFWHPSKIISYCASVAQYDNGLSRDISKRMPTFLYYESMHDSYFDTLDSMYKSDPVWEYNYDMSKTTTFDENTQHSAADLNKQYSTIHKLEFIESFDSIKRNMTGALAHQVFEYNFLNKRWSAKGQRLGAPTDSIEAKQKFKSGSTETDPAPTYTWNGPGVPQSGTTNHRLGGDDSPGYYYNFNYWYDFNSFYHADTTDANKSTADIFLHTLQGNENSWNDTNAKQSIVYTNSSTHSGYVDNYAEIKAVRDSILAGTEMVKLRITVPGRSDMEVGMAIRLKITSATSLGNIEKPTDADDIYDKYWSGKYVISNIKHVISQKDHMMVMDIFKDSVSSNFRAIDKIAQETTTNE